MKFFSHNWLWTLISQFKQESKFLVRISCSLVACSTYVMTLLIALIIYILKIGHQKVCNNELFCFRAFWIKSIMQRQISCVIGICAVFIRWLVLQDTYVGWRSKNKLDNIVHSTWLIKHDYISVHEPVSTGSLPSLHTLVFIVATFVKLPGPCR